MKHKLLLLAWIIAITTTSGSGCKKNKLTELEKLPPATQSGAKTFGCLVNGKAWIPAKEDWFSTSALRFYYDNINGGEFSIRAEYQNSSQNRDDYIGIGVDSILHKKTYVTNTDSLNMGLNYSNHKITSICRTYLPNDSLVKSKGEIMITRFDLTNGIISGTFEFSLSKSGCETITITHGRFDAKL
ncbi:MAG: hypothetical protein K2Q24_14205 [Chitinophagaceae bacterium]|jgi:hypothetical protein|nr:hypothetical protein [Chitinophagaceae bacterium]